MLSANDVIVKRVKTGVAVTVVVEVVVVVVVVVVIEVVVRDLVQFRMSAHPTCYLASAIVVCIRRLIRNLHNSTWSPQPL